MNLKTSCTCGLATAGLLWIATAHAAAPSLDPIGALKRSGLAALRAHLPSPPAGVTVDLAIDNADLELDETTLTIDDGSPVRARYGDREARAFRVGGWCPLARTALAPGRHRLHFHFAARRVGAAPSQPRVMGDIEQDVAMADAAGTVLIQLRRRALLGDPRLDLAPVTAAAPDPRLQEVRYRIDAGQPLAALIALDGEAGARSGPEPATAAALRRRARQAFGAEPGDDDAAPSASARAALAAYNDAVTARQAGDLPRAEQDLRALAEGAAEGDIEWTLRDRANVLLGYVRLRRRAGAAAAEAFARVRSTGCCTDGALLGLGWALLTPAADAAASADAHPPVPTALPRLPSRLMAIRTVPTEGPRDTGAAAAARRALGPWSQLIGRDPLEAAVQEAWVAIPYALNHLGAQAEAIDYDRRAIALLGAVDRQLGIAEADIGAGALHRLLAAEASRPDAANDGWLALMPPMHWWLAADPSEPLAAPGAFYLPQLMRDPGFRTSMAQRHDLQQLATALAGLGPVPDVAEARQRIDRGIAALDAALSARARADLAAIRRRTQTYLAEAHFALARSNEPIAEARR